ncbi:Uncharacterised protein g11330 [Pycnogonum litorale]
MIFSGIDETCDVHVDRHDSPILTGSCRRNCGDDAEFTNADCADQLKCCVSPRGAYSLCANDDWSKGYCWPTCEGTKLDCTPGLANICSSDSVCCDPMNEKPALCY